MLLGWVFPLGVVLWGVWWLGGGSGLAVV
jgi:hypothetical protein